MSLLIVISGILLAAATLAALLDLGSARGDRRVLVQSLSGTALLLLGGFLLASWRGPATTAGVLAWIALGSVVAHLTSIAWLKVRALAPFLLPLAAAASLAAPLAGDRPWASAGPSAAPWARVHGIASLLGFSAFALAFAAGALYLVQARRLKGDPTGAGRLPSLETLDRLNLAGLLLALPCWTAALVAGILSAQASWGGNWMRTPLVLFSTATWAILAAVTAARLTATARGPKIAALSIAAFLLALAALLGGHR